MAYPNTERVSPDVLSWVEDLRRASQAIEKRKKPSNNTRLFYVLTLDRYTSSTGIVILKGKNILQSESWNAIERALIKPPQFINEDDTAILRILWEAAKYRECETYLFPERNTVEFVHALLSSNRFYHEGNPDAPLTLGETRPGDIHWQIDSRGKQYGVVRTTPRSKLVLLFDPPFYLDVENNTLGTVSTDVPHDLLLRVTQLPPLSQKEAFLVADTLREFAPKLPVPDINALKKLRKINVKPVPILTLQSIETHTCFGWRGYSPRYSPCLLDIAVVFFRYEEIVFPCLDEDEFATLLTDETVHILRDRAAEKAFFDNLMPSGLEVVSRPAFSVFGRMPSLSLGLSCEKDWDAFMKNQVPYLKAAGWEIIVQQDFRHDVLVVDAWEADLIDKGNGWFDLDMGIMVEGQRLPLAPLLANLFQRDPAWLDGAAIAKIPDNTPVDLRTENGRRLVVSAGRIKRIALTLIDLFDGLKEGNLLSVSRFDAPRLAALHEDMARWQFRGEKDIFALAKRLEAAQGVHDILPPKGLGLDLRGYQKEGLSWLQFLQEHNLSGILADDMGLGKTAQTLAHLLLEKEAGRLTQPALVVLPTSLIFNWKNETSRFAPSLKVLSLHGALRKPLFDAIPESDLILTTYPLLWRDVDELKAHTYHLLILDEAQMVKNNLSKTAAAVRQIKANHRLCLTGTPLENHLGELWSLFDFLLPGFLGSQKSFSKFWRTPIEKQGANDRRQLLAKRIAPFILRRKKEEVAKELPPKTIIIRTVELDGGQRDLYETVRSAMDEKVREEIERKGLARSQIIILDALLKLRQVCCDPRLVNNPRAKNVKESAKLDLLMDMLPEMVEEGRRILLFSQFTSMLALIEAALDAEKLPYVILTGDTKDRESPVKAFQSGKVPIFLISLKAGGVGLNLTAADTVIHYDPWWNPAVENQATDRAHRLGQDKPVFVYKLVVSGSIEEKILALQEKKAELARSILSEDHDVSVKFGAEDLAALFAALPEESR